ncbi:retrovirus-related pol polyprotein from transposon TNT 1-94 [Tanacetum coccineum]
MYDGEMLHSTSLNIHSPDFKETLKDAEESRLKMRNKIVKINYEKLNALYEIFVPQQEPSVEQTYFSIPSASNDYFETKEVTLDLSNPQMPKGSIESSNSVRRPKSKDNKSKVRVLKNTNDKRPSAHVKRDLFTTLIAAKSKNLRATLIVAKSRLSVAKTPTATNKVIQLVYWIVDSGCSKHMTGNLLLLRNFVEKFIGTVRFGNDYFAAITRYRDYVQGNLKICHGDDLLTGSRESNLYTISIFELAASSPVCLKSKATSTKSWLWHQRLSHLNFGTINQLTLKDLVDGLSKFKYDKDHLGSACEPGKIKKASFPSQLIPRT